MYIQFSCNVYSQWLKRRKQWSWTSCMDYTAQAGGQLMAWMFCACCSGKKKAVVRTSARCRRWSAHIGKTAVWLKKYEKKLNKINFSKINTKSRKTTRTIKKTAQKTTKISYGTYNLVVNSLTNLQVTCYKLLITPFQLTYVLQLSYN